MFSFLFPGTITLSTKNVHVGQLSPTKWRKIFRKTDNLIVEIGLADHEGMHHKVTLSASSPKRLSAVYACTSPFPTTNNSKIG